MLKTAIANLNCESIRNIFHKILIKIENHRNRNSELIWETSLRSNQNALTEPETCTVQGIRANFKHEYVHIRMRFN